jgi:hypothetical protein
VLYGLAEWECSSDSTLGGVGGGGGGIMALSFVMYIEVRECGEPVDKILVYTKQG